jgi:hypothetical protein
MPSAGSAPAAYVPPPPPPPLHSPAPLHQHQPTDAMGGTYLSITPSNRFQNYQASAAELPPPINP